jgi:hypothetical protein
MSSKSKTTSKSGATVKTSKTSKAQAQETSKTNDQAPSAPVVVAPVFKAPAEHVLIVNDKDTGAKKYSCGAVHTSRTAKINAVLLGADKRLTTSEIIATLDALYGRDVVKCVRNHLSTLLTKGAVTFKDKSWALVGRFEAPAPATVENDKAPAKKRTRKSK